MPGAGCGNAVERAVWKVTLPSTFCMIWWMWPLSTVTEPKRLRIAERLRSVLGAPAPFGIDRPERHVREHDDRRRGGEAFHVVCEPFELIVAEVARDRRPSGSTTLTRPMKWTPCWSKLYQPAPFVPLP